MVKDAPIVYRKVSTLVLTPIVQLGSCAVKRYLEMGEYVMYTGEGLGYDIAVLLGIPRGRWDNAEACFTLSHNALNYEEIDIASRLGLWIEEN